jgi:hypothetical protein
LADHFGNNAAFSDPREPKTLHPIRKNLARRSLLPVIALLAACGEAPESAPAPAFLPARPEVDRSCGDGGSFSTRLYGALAMEIEWRGTELDCEGMPRPDGKGARLRFAGAMGDGTRDLAFIIALPDLERGEPARELASNVTLIAEGQGLFFSTPGLDTCWTDIDTRADKNASPQRFAVSGTLYCIAPIPEVNGTSSVSFEEVRFSGRLDWSAK